MMPPQHDCMIYRRNLPTGCTHCGMSDLYCQAVREQERRKCCDLCQHPEP